MEIRNVIELSAFSKSLSKKITYLNHEERILIDIEQIAAITPTSEREDLPKKVGLASCNNDEAKESAKAQLDSLKQQYESQSMDFKTVLSNYGYDSEDQLLDEMIVEANKEIVAKKYIRKAISDDEINKYYEDEIYGDYNAKHILIKAVL